MLLLLVLEVWYIQDLNLDSILSSKVNKKKIMRFYNLINKYLGLGEAGCHNVLIALTPAARTILSIVQMQFIFLNTKEFEMDRHKVVARFGLMHMVATNLCEWLYVLVEETKHEIIHLEHKNQYGKQFESRILLYIFNTEIMQFFF